MKKFETMKELAVYLKESNISKQDKKIMCDYFNNNDGLQDDGFFLASEDEVIKMLVEEMQEETLIYFATWFLCDYTSLSEKAVKAIQETGENEILVGLLADELEEMAADAISLDGAGNFLNHYDGSHEEVYINDESHYFWFN